MPTKKHKQIARTTGIYFSAVIVAIASIFWVNALILAWTAPVSAPPADNISAPLNTGATGQSKAGGLILNTGGAATGLIVDKGNVGIGTVAPASKLEVAGTIHSTTGGIKFPDDTVQATAGSAAKKYNSGWFPVTASITYTKAHGLGVVPDIVQVWWSNTSDGSGDVVLNAGQNYGELYTNWVYDIDATNIRLRTGPSYNYIYRDGTGAYKYGVGGYYKIVALTF